MRLQSYQNIIKLLRRYLDKIAETFKSIDSDKYDKTIDTIINFEAKLSNIKDITNAKDCIEQYYLYGELDGIIDSVVKSVTESKYFDKYVYKYSQTFVAEITTIRVAILDAYSVYQAESKKFDDVLFPTIKLDGVPEITDKPNRFIVYALAKWVPIMQSPQPVLDKIELAKDKTLNVGVRQLTDILPYRYGLKPHSVVAEIPDNTIVIPASYGTPLSFDITPLVSEKYILENDLVMGELHGLHKKIIQRYNTIKPQQTGDIKFQIPDSPEYIACTWGGSSYIMLTDNQSIRPSTAAIRAVVRAYTEGPSVRPLAYNRPMQYTNIKIKSFANEYVMAKFTIDPDAITRPFVVSATDAAAELLKAHKEDFEKIMPDLTAKFIDILLKSIQRVVKPTNSQEIFITMIAKYEALIREFKKIYVKRVKIMTKWDDQLYEIQAALEHTIKEINKAKLWGELETSFKEYVINKSYIII